MDEPTKSPFELLAAVNVNPHTEKKNDLTYLSWAWAWDQLMRRDPNADYEYLEPKMFGDTMMVYCRVTAFNKARVAHLPVMDYKNKPIHNPDAFAVNTAMQRALVKAIALHGLGLYIYAGEDLPEGEKKEDKKDGKPVFSGPITATSGAKARLDAEQITKVEEAASRVADWVTAGSFDDAVTEKENAELDADETVYFWTFFDSKARAGMKKAHAAIHAKQLESQEAQQA